MVAWGFFIIGDYLIRSDRTGIRQWVAQQSMHLSILRGAKFLYTLVSPTVAAAGFSHFQCVEIDGHRWLRKELELECYSTSEWKYQAVWAVFAILQAALPPVVILIYLYQADRSGARFQSYWGHWTVNFQPHAFWFEPFRLIRKVGFVMVVFIFQRVEEQAFVATVLWPQSRDPSPLSLGS